MKKSSKISLIAAGILYSACSFAQLLGVVPEAPSFIYNAGGTTTFDAGTGFLEVDATPLDYLVTTGGTPLDIFPLQISPNILIRLELDSSCNLVTGDAGDDLQIIGDIDRNGDFVPEQSGTLLTGEISDFALDIAGASGAIMLADAKFGITGGELVTAGEYVIGDQVGVTVEISNNNFIGDCMSSWLGGAKGSIGSIPDDPDPQCCFDVVKAEFKDYTAHQMCYGSGSGSHGSGSQGSNTGSGSGSGSHKGKNGSKFKIDMNVECKPGFDPLTDVVTLTFDGPPGGEVYDFTGTFVAKSGNKYKSKITGTPKLYAELNCAKGTLEIVGSNANFDQIDFSDGVDVNLVLGPDYNESLTVTTTPSDYKCGLPTKHKYKNPAPIDCVSPEPPGECVTEWYKVKVKKSGQMCAHGHYGSHGSHGSHGGSGSGSKRFIRYKGGDIGSTIILPDGSVVDSSCGTLVTCGATFGTDPTYTIVEIESKVNESIECDITSTSDDYNDVHGSHGSGS